MIHPVRTCVNIENIKNIENMGDGANYSQYLKRGLGVVAVPIIVHGNHSTYICHIQLKIILIDRY